MLVLRGVGGLGDWLGLVFSFGILGAGSVTRGDWGDGWALLSRGLLGCGVSAAGLLVSAGRLGALMALLRVLRGVHGLLGLALVRIGGAYLLGLLA